MSERFVSALCTFEVGDATRAISWLREHEPLPHALASLLITLEFGVGRVWVEECFTDAEKVVTESDEESAE